MSIIERIPEHRISVFKFEDVRSRPGGRYVKSYYHDLTRFLPYHTHDFYEINIVYSGVGKHQLAGRELLTQKGDVFIIPPHARHGYSCHETLTVYHILLSNLFVANFDQLLKKMRGYDLLFNFEPMLREHVEKAFYLKAGDIPFEVLKTHIDRIEFCTQTEEDYETEKAAHVLSLIATLSKSIHELKPLNIEALPNEHVLTVIESMEYIEGHCEEKLDFMKMPLRSALSYSTYLKYFKKLSGTTPAKYQNSCRIRKAVGMLLNSNDSILTIALSCGFYDSSHFIREFMKEKQVSPSDFRQGKTVARL